MNAKARKLSYVAITSLVVLLYICFQVLIMTGVISRYEQGILIFIFINIILAVSLNVVVGCLGQITLGHAGFMSIGAYAAALFTKAGIIPGIPGYIVGLLLGGVLAGLVGLLIGIPALRLKGDYLAIITLAFGEIIRALIEYFDFTGGAQGLNGIPRFQNFTLIYIIMIISVTLMFSVMTSRHG
ncbi:MAG: branched-chain amino acid ABC transporter permease, partial [Tissierellia bacterium]|nr:branched-chain amino acid ABC transporter permease [Tissierellia bacterium]